LTAAAAVVLLVGPGAAFWAWKPPPTNASSSTGAVAEALDPRRIAVLYFEDQSPEHELAPLATGLTESLIERLDQVRTLDAISKNGVEQFRGVEIDPDSVAGILKAGTVVRGRVEVSGSRVRVEVRLIDGNSGTEIKRASFSGPRGNLVVLQDSLAAEVARFLRERLGEEVRLRERRASTHSTEAWLLLQRAEKLRRDADELTSNGNTNSASAALVRADSVLAAAEAADPAWLEPIVKRGATAIQRSQLERELNAVPWVDVASGHAERALQRAPNNPEALALRGTSRFQRWRLRVDPNPAALDRLLQSARRDLETAVAADPRLARANITLSYLYYQTDDVPGALLAARHAYEEDAYLEDADQTLTRLFWGSLDLEQFGEARRWCSEGSGRFPRDHRFMQCQLWLMATPADRAEVDRAWQLLAALDSLTPAPQRGFVVAQGRILVAAALARAGLPDSARSVLRRTRQRITHDIDPDQDLLSQEAYVRTLIGDSDIAIDLLKKYVAANPGHEFLQQAGQVWWWRALRTHPRWREIGHAGR
jgi:serine/threonine-protein kinase